MSELASQLQHKLIPWARQGAAQRFIIARPEMNEAALPPGVELHYHKIRGPRVIVKNQRIFSNTRGLTALWPEAALNEVSKPKMLCVLDGHIDYQLGHYRLRCGPGHFIFMPPGTPHPDGGNSYADMGYSQTCEVLFFLLHPNAIECWISLWHKEVRREAGKYLMLQQHATDLLRVLMEELFSGEAASSAIGEGLLSSFFLLVQREAEAGRLQSIRSNSLKLQDERQNGATAQTDFTTRLEQYVQSNLHKSLTLESVARELLLSRTQFIRLVRQETGCSFNEFLAARRIDEAKRLLLDSPWTVNAIAYFVGFKSASYFRTLFRQQVGYTPGEFRRHNKTESS